MTAKKTKPDQLDVELIRRLSWGYTALEGGSQLGLGKWATQQRIRRLKELTGSTILPQLTYWMHTHYYLWPQTRKIPTPKPDPLKLEVIQLRAHGYSAEQIQRQLYLSKGGYERRIRDAHILTRTKHDSHIVSVCWSEDFIV